MLENPVQAQSQKPRLAALMVVTAMALMGLVDNFVATIGETAGLWQFQVIRSAIALALLTAFARWRNMRLVPVRWRPVLARSFILSSALILYFSALALLPISEAVAGLFTAPIFVLLISALVYGHRIGPIRIGAVVFGFAGVLMVLRPDAGDISIVSLLPVLAGVLYAFAMVATREWCEQESPLTLLYGFFAGMGVWGLIGLLVLWLFPQPVPDGPAGFPWRLWGEMNGEAWFWTVAQSIASLVAVYLITRAYQMSEASHIVVFEYALLLFAVLWGWLLLGISIDVWAGVGIVLIIASGTTIALRGGKRAVLEAPAGQS